MNLTLMKMMNNEDLSERIEALETKAAFQEHTLGELDATIIRQQTTLDALRMEIDTLHDRLRALTANLSNVSDDDAPPPHY
ncbi:MAG: SlyX family protein [Gammaproteobacteria bacterium]|nr:SlyX family protein [Gammaproteobacteria bacterium]